MPPLPDVTRWFHPVLPTRALGRAPVRILLAGRAYVLFRGAGQRPVALVDRCPHRFAPLSQGRVGADGRLACPYHGLRFDAEGRGESPTQAGLRCHAEAMQLVERHGYLWMAAADADPARFPELDAPGWAPGEPFDVAFNAPLAVVLDNFSEDEHVPWVHTRLGWDAAQAADVAFEAEAFADRTEVRYRGPQRPSVLMRVLLVRPGDRFENTWVHRFDPVRATYEIAWTDPAGAPRPIRNRVHIFFVPETETTTRLHVFPQLRIELPSLQFLLPIAKRAARALGIAEVRDDARFLARMGLPGELTGARLGRFDKAVVHNRVLTRRVYYGEGAGAVGGRAGAAVDGGAAVAAEEPAA